MGRLQRPGPGTRRGRFGRGPGLRALALAAAALAALMLAAGVGSVPVSPADIARVLAHRLLGTPLPADFSPILEGLVLNIRLPRAALAFGREKETDWQWGRVVEGPVTPEFARWLLELPKPADTEVYNKMTPFFSIFLDNGFYSSHYGTELGET